MLWRDRECVSRPEVCVPVQLTDREPPSIIIMQSLPRTGALHWKRLAEAARVHRAGKLAPGVRRDFEGESRPQGKLRFILV